MGASASISRSATSRGGRWLLELTFRHGATTRTLSVGLAGEGTGYAVELPGVEGTTNPVARSPGWHRVTVQFGRGSLRVLLDESALWYNLEHGPGGALRQVRLVCQAGQDKVPRTGSVAVTEFSVARGVEEPVRPGGDPEQDEVWLATGDQLFGSIVQADARTVTLEARYGRRTLPWTDIRGCFLARREQKPPPALAGQQVRLWLLNGLAPDPDVLDGVVVGLDEQHLRLRHARLGELKLDRRRLRQVRPLGR